MTTSPTPASPLFSRSLSRALRHALGAAAVLSVAACGSATDGSASSAATPAASSGITFTGSARALVLPTTDATPTFSNVAAALVGFEALADPNQTTPTALASGRVSAASSTCSTDGCAFHLGGVSLADTSRGLYAQISSSTTFGGSWFTSYSMVANGNQVVTSKTDNAAITAFAPAILPATATITNFAKLLGISQAEMLARGASLALVSKTRSNGATWGDGVSTAYVSLTTAVAGTSFVYPTADYLKTQSNGTNADGAVLVVGPPVSAAATPASYAYPVTVTAAGSGLTFGDATVLLRPGSFIFTALLPQR